MIHNFVRRAQFRDVLTLPWIAETTIRACMPVVLRFRLPKGWLRVGSKTCNQVTPRQVREFQGAPGPFDRGIFMTTSVFTQQAEDQAAAPGYKPIDLIDGERLVELLIERRLGIKDVTLVDHEFFTPFK